MPLQIPHSAMMTCSFGMAPSMFNCLPVSQALTANFPSANIMDHVPFLNIPPFAMCMSMANPMVAAATAAAQGVLTPMPCIPMTLFPWMPGSPTALVGKFPALRDSDKCMCLWAGNIQFITPSQVVKLVA